jgi:hypothetical protein
MTTLDTTVTEPPRTAGETEMLVFALERSRAQFAWKSGGLEEAALRRTYPPSTMTLGGLLKHLTLVEDYYTSVYVLGAPMPEPWRQENFDADPDWAWHSAANDTAEDLYAMWRNAVERSRAAWSSVLANGGPDQPSKRVNAEGSAPNLRRIIVDLHDEYARHNGHADLFREAIDGVVGEDPPQTS